MKRRPFQLSVMAAVAVAAVALAGCGDDKASSTTTAKSGSGSGGSLVVCSDIPYEPMEFEATKTSTPSGYTGFDIDLAQQIASDNGKTLEVKVTPFDGIFAALNAGSCDVIASSVTITDDRKKNVDFSTPYFDSNQSLMVLKTNAGTFETLADLKGKNIGVQSGTTGEEYVKKNTPAGATVTALPGAADLFAALKSGSIDAIVQDYPINAYRATQDDSVTITDKIKTDEQYGMAVKKGNAATLKVIDDGIAKAKSDGTYDKLYEKYFGEKPPTS